MSTYRQNLNELKNQIQNTTSYINSCLLDPIQLDTINIILNENSGLVFNFKIFAHDLDNKCMYIVSIKGENIIDEYQDYYDEGYIEEIIDTFDNIIERVKRMLINNN